MPAFVMLEPIHIHSMPGFASCGGDANNSSSDAARVEVALSKKQNKTATHTDAFGSRRQVMGKWGCHGSAGAARRVARTTSLERPIDDRKRSIPACLAGISRERPVNAIARVHLVLSNVAVARAPRISRQVQLATVFPLTVVVIEDNSALREGLCRLVANDFYLVGSADNGVAGVEAVLRLKPNVVVLDIHMAGMDGFEVARQIRIAEPSVRIVMQSADVSDQAYEKAFTAGASALVSKTKISTELRVAIHVAMRREPQRVPVCPFSEFFNSK